MIIKDIEKKKGWEEADKKKKKGTVVSESC